MKIIFSAALLALAANSAFAADIYQVTRGTAPERTLRGEQGAQLYGGASYGASYVDFDCTGAPNCKRESTGFKLYAGFNITAHIAAELGYVGFGKGTAEAVGSGFSVNEKYEASAVVLNGAFRFDVTPAFSGVVRLGLARVKSEFSLNVLGLRGSFSETKTAPLIGLGLEYTVAQSLKAIAALDFTKSELDDEKSDVRLISLGLQYGF